MSWAARRRSYYIGGVFFLLSFFSIIPLIFFLHKEPTCFDGKQNGDERGADCGGSCRVVCKEDVIVPKVLWSRSFKVAPGVYNSVAYVENPNFGAGVEDVSYRFSLFDDRGIAIVERSGRTYLMPGGITPIFEGTITTGERVPKRTIFELGEITKWVTVRDRETLPLDITDRAITNIKTAPRINANVVNESINDIFDIEVVSVIYDINDNAIGASRTIVKLLPRQSSEPIVFTWPEPFEIAIERCLAPVDVVLAIDVSGSMNDDSVSPPQPLSDAKRAADDFIGRLSRSDRIGFVSFATESRVEWPLSYEHALARSVIGDLTILPEEEVGSTNTGAALREALSAFADADGEGAERNIIILLTDGKANEPKDPGGEVYAEEEARRVKEAGMEFFTIGLGMDINAPFLSALASSPSHYFPAATSKELDEIYQDISDDLCERGPAIIDIIPKKKDFFFNSL